jgi:hypothetical protein
LFKLVNFECIIEDVLCLNLELIPFLALLEENQFLRACVASLLCPLCTKIDY